MSDISTTFHEEEGRVHVYREQDVQPVLDAAAAARAVTDGKSKSGELFYEAEVPGVVIEDYCNKAGITFAEFMGSQVHIKRLLNDPGNKMFRIHQGRV